MKIIKYLTLTLLFINSITITNAELVIDGNGDGILDNEQTNVITIPDAVTGEYLTLVTDNCPINLVSAHTEQEFENKESNSFPQGIFYYELQCKEADITIYFHGINQLRDNLTYQKYGPIIPGDLTTSTWYSLPNVTFSEIIVNEQSIVTANFTLKDGELGDDTGVDGRIVDPGGVAYNDDVGNVISFISKTFTASRKSEQAVITINRNGLIGSFSVNYSIKGNTAIVGQDFQTVNGTLFWNENERGDKNFTIPLAKDATIGTNIQLNLTNLSPLQEDSLLGIETAILTITDDDILTTLTPTPIQPLPSTINSTYVQSSFFTDDLTIT
ncbi:MAG: hypothetical protein IMF12_02225, partial [Proteobacteria bacterium]|nr:hypothetical protein [Pseudomonadota bacterium]